VHKSVPGHKLKAWRDTLTYTLTTPNRVRSRR
jgi:hypothetical protein